MQDLRDLLTAEFAQQICEIFLEETGKPVIMADKDGIIFAATDKKRIGNFHSVAKKVMNGELKEGVVTVEQAQSMENVKPGINIPIIYKGIRITSLGIAGDPTVVRPYVGLASRLVQLWLKNQELLNQLTGTINNINGELQEIAAAVEEVTAGAQQIADASQQTHRTTTESMEKIKKVESVLRSIKQIATQSNMIGLNASIEAARVGEAGRGFAVVANEIRKLAASSEESVKDINEVLQEIQTVFNDIAGKVEENKVVTQEQSDSLMTVADRISSIENSMNDLVQRIQHSE
ncbi:methyl-accepting chemotaxis protein [Effusibacillus lacus]|nr:methyl-accepting chemotaxis protein [Effusibacillus lacus]TCS66830.1 methyl-accepting chemotaxis protein (MCP) signaling protein [Effusibacillus lacus]